MNTGHSITAAQCETEDGVIDVARDADAIIAQYATVGARAIGALTRHHDIENSDVLKTDVPILAYCAKCDAPRPVNSVEWFVCPECRSPISQVLQGKELQVVGLEIQ